MTDDPNPTVASDPIAAPPVLEPPEADRAQQEENLAEKLHACAFGHEPPQGRQPLFGR